MGFFTPIGDLFGLNGDQGDYFQGGQLNNSGTVGLAQLLNATTSANMNKAGQGLVSGGSLADALKGLDTNEVGALASSPIYGNIVAADQVKSDPILSSLYGDGGELSKAQ